MSITLSLQEFQRRLAGRAISVAKAGSEPALQGDPGLQRTVERAAAVAGDDRFVAGDREQRALFGELSKWYGAPGSTSESLVAKADGALLRAVDALVAVAESVGNPGIDPELALGARGSSVMELQGLLQRHGFNPGTADGDFGANTLGAVTAFQRSRGLDADGVVGPRTWAALRGQPGGGTVAPTPAPPGAGGANARLDASYSRPDVYASVERAVRRFYPPNKSNGCVAYMSEALRQAGVAVPIRNDASGENISLVTRPFSRYLEGTLGWQRVNGVADLRPGDVCFTQDDPSWPGYPAHTFMFHRWHDQARGLAYVVDNQDQVHLRNILEDRYHEFNFTPFSYALRAPA